MPGVRLHLATVKEPARAGQGGGRQPPGRLDQADACARGQRHGAGSGGGDLTERAAAEAAVAGLTGVRNVKNHIDISYIIDPLDVDLHVQQPLHRSALVPDDSDVTSDTKDSVITLTGHVRTWAEHDAVVGAAWMARGAIEVRDELQITG